MYSSSQTEHFVHCFVSQRDHTQLEGIKKNLDVVTGKAQEVLAAPEQASTPVLRSELEITLQKMDQVYSLSSVYLEK